MAGQIKVLGNPEEEEKVSGVSGNESLGSELLIASQFLKNFCSSSMWKSGVFYLHFLATARAFPNILLHLT